MYPHGLSSTIKLYHQNTSKTHTTGTMIDKWYIQWAAKKLRQITKLIWDKYTHTGKSVCMTICKNGSPITHDMAAMLMVYA